MALSESIGLLLRIRADSSQAKQEFGEFKKEFAKTEQEIKARGGAFEQFFKGFTNELGYSGQQAAVLKNQFSELGGLLSGVATGFVAVGAGITAVAAGMFALTKQAADYAGALFDVQEKTGLTAQTISALDIAAKQSGTSIDSVSAGAAKFARIMGEAAAGNKNAQKTLADLHITSNDLATALDQAGTAILSAKNGTDQLIIAQKLFGRGGAELIPLFKQMQGGLAAFQKEAERLGLTFTNEDLKRADAFGDTFEQISTQAKVLSSVLALQLAPVFTRVMENIGAFLAENQGTFRAWGETIAAALSTIIGWITQALNAFNSLPAPVKEFLVGLVAVVGSAAAAIGGLVLAFTTLAPILGTIVTAILAVVGAFVQLGPVIAVVAAEWAVLYDVWSRNVGGIRDVTLEIFEKIKSVISGALSFIEGLWTAHGASVLKIVSDAWNTIERVLDAAVRVIADALRVGLDIINGNWSKAWDDFVRIIQDAARLAAQYWALFLTNVEKVFTEIISLIVKNGAYIETLVVFWVGRAAEAITTFLIDLPGAVARHVPQIVAAFFQLGKAIYNGIMQGVKDAASGATTASGVAGAATSFIGASAGGSLIDFGGLTGGVPKAGGAESSAADERKAALEDEQKAAKTQLDILEKQYADSLEKIRAEFAKTGEVNAFKDAISNLATETVPKLSDLANRIGDLGVQLSDPKHNLAAKAEWDKILQTANDKLDKSYEQNDKLIDAHTKKNYASWSKYVDDLAKKDEAYTKEQDRQYAERTESWSNYIDNLAKKQAEQDAEDERRTEEQKRIRQERLQAAVAEGTQAGPSSLADTLNSALIPPGDEFTNKSGAIVAGIDAITGAMGSMGQAVGQAVSAWVLYGNIGGSISKVTAQVLASIAQQATVQAIWEAAQGLAMLALAAFGHPQAGPSATFHFAAAAVYGGIAGIAAIAGRSFAGNQFASQSAAATGSTAGATQGSQSTAAGAYSGQPDQIIETGANGPGTYFQPQQIQVNLVDKTGAGFSQFFRAEIENNSPVRQLIIDTANA